MTKTEVTVLHVAAEVDVVAEKDNEKRYLLNSAKVSCAKVGSGCSDVDVNGNDSVNGVVVEPDGNCVVEEEHEVKSESDSVPITMHQQEVCIEAEKENETRYLVNGANTSSVKVGSGSTDVYVNVNGSDSVNGVVVESGDNCIVEKDHEVKSESDSVTMTMNQQEVDIVAEKENETRYLLNGANASCVKVGFGSFDGSDSVNGVVVESGDNYIVEDDHEVKSESDSVTITMHQQEVGIEAEKENETSYLLNGANTSSVKVGSGSTDVYVNVNGSDSVNGVVVESGDNCIVEEDHEVKSESDSVTITMNQQEVDIVAEKENETSYLLNGANASCLKVGFGSFDVYVNVSDSVNGVVVESDDNYIVEDDHEVKSESDSVTITMHQQEVGIEAEKENETSYLLNGTNKSRIKVGSVSTDVYVNVNGSDSVNGVVVESGDNCIVEEDHEVKSESDSVTFTMNQQEVDIVAEKEKETRYLLNGANASCVKVSFGSFDVYVNGSDSVNGVVVESGDNCIVEDDHEVKSESDSITITRRQQEVGIEAEKENETSYLLNGANTSSVKVGSGSTDVYVNVNGSDSVNGVVVESGDNCIVEEDHEVKSESDSVTISMNQQEVDIVAEKEKETSYLLNGANVSCLKVGFGSFDVYANGSDSVNGVVLESGDNYIVEDDHKVKSESDSVTITMHQQEVGIEAEKENETSYLLNGANTSCVKVGSSSTDVYVNVNGSDSVNGVVVESGDNCIVEEDHEVKSESDSVTISMNQQEGEKPVEEKGGYVQEKSGDGDDCLAKQTVQEAAVVIDSRVEKSDSVSESSVVIDSGLKQSDGKVDGSVETDANSIVINSVTTDDDATHIEIKTGSESSQSSTTVETDTNFVVGSISFSVDVQSNQYNGNLANSEIASQLVDKSLDVVSGLKSETNVSSDSISVVVSNPAERTCGVTDGGIEFGSLDDEAERKAPFNYMIRVPRNNDESLKVKIRLAQTKVDEKSRIRDGIRNDMQSTRVTCKEYGNDFNAAVSQERKARDFHRSKCREIESMQSMMDIEDIDVKIRNMEWTIQHETLPLKDEKKFISDIKQLKQTREKLSSTMSRQDENQQGLDGKERLKSLKKEADQLKANLKNAEAITKAAKRKYYEETEKLSELQYQFKAANHIQQEAYAQLQSLKKQSYEKSKHFWQYKDDLNKANELASKGDKVALQNFCINQVEKFMDLWNNNDEFRKEYIRCNERSTLWRLRTLDGRALGPGEVPPVIPRAVNGKAVVDHTMSGLTLEDRTQELEAAKKAEKVLAEKVVEQKKFTKSAPPESVSTTASNGEKIEEAEEEKPKRTKEEEESDRKAEELRKEEEAAKLKEQRQFEEIAKAKEALERKRRKAEKDEAREANRAAKEAEKKEKKREKRAKKKEKQKAVATAADTGIEDEALSACSTSETLAETSKEIENKEKPIAATTERPQKASKFVKQAKVTAIPPPIRNRGKQKMRPWMRVILTFLVILALFFLGNYI
ncbi:uncharacterized protein LOC108451123 [Gossypium arboreum]|uniref:uncharacterized protein LOC108451123 n=1 Tax=Gossypium arboreum TaxID=29729 RepID=UPI00081922D6|nr:uncharacterized protein LOC108451123 [Gossypium arboreum]